AKGELRKLLSFPSPVDQVLGQITKGYPFTRTEHDEIFAYATPKHGGKRFVDQLAGVDPDALDADVLIDVFLTQAERTAKKTMLVKAVATLIPDIAERLQLEGARIEGLVRELGRAEMVARSEALLDLLDAIVGLYEKQKRA